MRFSDWILLWKKIGVGILVTAIPLVILAGGLWAGQRAMKRAPQPSVSRGTEASNAH